MNLDKIFPDQISSQIVNLHSHILIAPLFFFLYGLLTLWALIFDDEFKHRQNKKLLAISVDIGINSQKKVNRNNILL